MCSLGVGDLMGLRIVGPAEHVAVEGGGAVGVGRPHRDVADVAVLDLDRRPGDRPAEHPPMPERVDDGGVARAVVLVGLPLHHGATFPRPLEGGVGVGARKHQAHRSLPAAQALSGRARDTRRPGRARRRRSAARHARCGRRPSRTSRRPATRRTCRRTRRWRRARRRRTGRAARRAAGAWRRLGSAVDSFSSAMAVSVPLMTTPPV